MAVDEDPEAREDFMAHMVLCGPTICTDGRLYYLEAILHHWGPFESYSALLPLSDPSLETLQIIILDYILGLIHEIKDGCYAPKCNENRKWNGSYFCTRRLNTAITDN